MRIVPKCMNEKCNNYKLEMNQGVEICSLCNTPVTKFESKVSPKLAFTANMITIIGFIAGYGGGWALGMLTGIWQLGFIVRWGGVLAMPVALFFGIRSRSKFSIALSSVLFLIALFFELYWVIEQRLNY